MQASQVFEVVDHDLKLDQRELLPSNETVLTVASRMVPRVVLQQIPPMLQKLNTEDGFRPVVVCAEEHL
jgi:hypothetical protein